MGRSIQTTWDSVEKMTWGQFTEDREIVFSIPAGWNARESREDRERCHAQIVNSVPSGWKRIGEIDGYEIYRKPGIVFDPHGYVAVRANTFDGGPGSGNFGHAGRPGEVGGSAPDKGAGSEKSSSSGSTKEAAKKEPPKKLAKGETPVLKPKYTSRKTAIEDAESQIRNGRYEVGVLVSATGEILLNKTDGRTGEVNFSGYERSLFRDAHMTHNHPDGSPFSYNDIGIAIQDDLKEIRACSKNGWESLTRKYKAGNAPPNARFFARIYDMQWPVFKELALGWAAANDVWDLKKVNEYMHDIARDWLEEHAPNYGWEYKRGKYE